MTETEKKKIRQIIDEQIQSVEDEIKELTELTKPVSLDASIGRLSRMDAINNKAINEMALRDKKRCFPNWKEPKIENRKVNLEYA